jgi:hypothetical protein
MDAAHGACHNRLCVNPRHLSWKTRKENVADTLRDGTRNCGVRNGRSKLSEAEILEIRADQRYGRKIAKDFGVTRQTISDIKLGRTWQN